MTSFRVGLIGAGFEGRNLATAVMHTASMSLVVVFDAVDAVAAECAHFTGARQAHSAEEVVAAGVDLVIVSTPNDLHLEPTLLALEAGATVLVEKPLVIDAPSLDLVMAAASTRPGRLVVGHVLRTYPGVRRLVETVASGALGATLSIDASRTRIVAPPICPPTWKHDMRRSGGELLHEIHELDLLCLVGGAPVDVSSLAALPTRAGADPVVRHSLLRFANGAIGHHVIASAEHYRRWTLSVSGGGGTAVADFGRGTVELLRDGLVADAWPVFDAPDVNAALIASSSGPVRHNRAGAMPPTWMTAGARLEMAELARILGGASDSILLQQPDAAVRVGLRIYQDQPQRWA